MATAARTASTPAPPSRTTSAGRRVTAARAKLPAPVGRAPGFGTRAASTTRELAIAFMLVGTLALLIVPVPPPILDFLLATSIAFSLVVFLVSFYVREPVEFSVFPTLLLISTVYRLALNISTTRLILSNGDRGTEAAGHIVSTFGHFVTGGNFAVGLVIFLILVLINFVVVTKGAGRIAEVAARFTLDAMPGKQMAIDADLNAGLIQEDEARRRRKEVMLEADFHGAMDGASKFIRGDAVAGIMITVINLIGGLFIGVVQLDMTAAEAGRTYSILTIGDGLVSQVPALIISVASGMLVSRVSSEKSLDDDLGHQLFGTPKVLLAASAILMPFALVPGLRMPFLIIALAVGITGWLGLRRQEVDAQESGRKDRDAHATAALAESEDPLQPVDTLEMEVGFDVIALVDERRGGELMQRITRLRRQSGRSHGLVVPPIQVRDNLRLQATEYLILVRGTEVARGDLRPGMYLAIDPGGRHAVVPGIPGKEPAFGLPALWVKEEHRRQAEQAGYTVVDPATVLSTHLSEIIKSHAHEFLGRQEAQQLLERIGKTHPKVVDDLVPNLVPLGTVVQVLRNLLREQVSVRDMLTILETMADAAPTSVDPDYLTERVRQALGRQIAAQAADPSGTIHYVALTRPTEELIKAGIQREHNQLHLVLDPTKAQELLKRLGQEVEKHAALQVLPVILAAPNIRSALRRLTERALPQISVLSPNELGEKTKLRRLGAVGL